MPGGQVIDGKTPIWDARSADGGLKLKAWTVRQNALGSLPMTLDSKITPRVRRHRAAATIGRGEFPGNSRHSKQQAATVPRELAY